MEGRGLLQEHFSNGRLNYCQVFISLEYYYPFTSLTCLIVIKSEISSLPCLQAWLKSFSGQWVGSRYDMK